MTTGRIVVASESQLAEAVAEWQRRFSANPSDFFTEAEAAALDPAQYGSDVAAHLIDLLQDIQLRD